MSILNLTQHNAAPDQLVAGVIEPADKGAVTALLTFEELPDPEFIRERARALARIARDSGHKKAMIGGAPWFMPLLEGYLQMAGVEPVYAFSRRESVEQPQADGSTKKVNVFRHAGFVPGTVGLRKVEFDEGYQWYWTTFVVGGRSYYSPNVPHTPSGQVPGRDFPDPSLV